MFYSHDLLGYVYYAEKISSFLSSAGLYHDRLLGKHEQYTAEFDRTDKQLAPDKLIVRTVYHTHSLHGVIRSA